MQKETQEIRQSAPPTPVYVDDGNSKTIQFEPCRGVGMNAVRELEDASANLMKQLSIDNKIKLSMAVTTIISLIKYPDNSFIDELIDRNEWNDNNLEWNDEEIRADEEGGEYKDYYANC